MRLKSIKIVNEGRNQVKIPAFIFVGFTEKILLKSADAGCGYLIIKCRIKANNIIEKLLRSIRYENHHGSD